MSCPPVDRVRDTEAMISGMAPMLDFETYVFCTVPDAAASQEAVAAALASFQEEEGLSLILPVGVAQRLNLETELPMRRITLTVNSALDGIGLTAAVAGVLAKNGIACNMVAATWHDHAFVPAVDAERALRLLQDLSGAPQVRDAARQ